VDGPGAEIGLDAAGTLHPAAFGRCPHPTGIPPGPTGAGVKTSHRGCGQLRSVGSGAGATRCRSGSALQRGNGLVQLQQVGPVMAGDGLGGQAKACRPAVRNRSAVSAAHLSQLTRAKLQVTTMAVTARLHVEMSHLVVRIVSPSIQWTATGSAPRNGLNRSESRCRDHPDTLLRCSREFGN